VSREGDEQHAGASGRRRRREGIAASPGVAIGPAYVVDRRKMPVPRRSIERGDVDAEIHRFRKGLRDTQGQLEQIKARLPHGEHRQILKAQQLMLRDPDMASHVEQLIREEHICAEWALARVTDGIRDTLQKAHDEYFRERSSDITFLAERVLLTLRGEGPVEIRPPAGAVVVAHDLPPADTAELARTEVVGMVTAVGGQTSHSAIVARSMEIPAVVGVDGIEREVETGDMVIVDAIHGVVVVRPSVEELEQWEAIRDRYERFEDRVQREHGLPASGRDGVHITLRANVALEAEIGSALFHGAEGVGLYRTEFMFMDREVPPTEEEHYRLAKNVLRRVAPYPVVFRTFDLGSDKPMRLYDFAERERNPAMGLRSLRLALRERDMFLAQLRGLLRAAVHGPLSIMLPLVSGLAELRSAFDAVAQARRQLEEAGIAHAQHHVPVGAMIEMPSAAIVADKLAPHLDFMSIGTNDLIQYTLAIDRDNDDVSYLYRPLHPAIVRLVRGVAAAGREHGIPVSVCGEMAADPRYTWVLVGLGVRELSMHPSAIPVIKNIIRGSDIREMEALADQVLEASDADEAEATVLAVMRERFPEHLQHGGGQPLHGERQGGGP
jgi:phosphoenolpyruvate-protein phosphotransferase (PTS system enzyme I)